MQWSLSLLNDDTKCLFWGVNDRNTETQKQMEIKKMRLDAVITFLVEWPYHVFILRGTRSKYWSKKNHWTIKKMRLDALIIFLTTPSAYFEGKLSKYWSQQKHEQTKKILLMHWSFFLLNDHSMCWFWGVNDRYTEAK